MTEPHPSTELSDRVMALQAEVHLLRQARDQQHDAERRLREQNAVLVALSQHAMSKSGDIGASIATITEASSRTLDVDRVGVWLFDPARTQAKCIGLFNRVTNEHMSAPVLAAADYPRYFNALTDGRTVAAHDARSDPRTCELRDSYLVPLGITSLLDAPIRRQGELIGLVCHEHVGKARQWTLEEEVFAGSIADYVLMALDSSERSAMEAKLSREKDVASKIIEGLPGIFYLFNQEGRYLRWNRNFERVTGYSSQEMLSRHPLDFFRPGDAEAIRDRIADVFESGRTTVETDLLHRDGTTTPYYFTGVRVEVDGEMCLAGMGVDISERRRAEQAVRESERNLRQVLDMNPALIFAKDRAGRYVLVNESMAAMFETSVHEMTGRLESDYVAPDEADRFRKSDVQIMNTGCEERVPEEPVRSPEGVVRWFQTVKRPLANAEGVANHVLGVATDITDRKRAEERRTLMIRELDHRVKNNLASVLSIADATVAHTTDLDGFVTAFRGRIHAMAVAHDLLARTRWQGADLLEIVERIVRPFQSEDGERIRFNGPKFDMPVEMAPSFSMVLNELTTNAVKYGALSVPAGRVSAEWTLEGTYESGPDTRSLRFVWQEHSGPVVAPPDHTGFGTGFIEQVVSYQLGGEVDLDFRPAGVHCTMIVPFGGREKRDVATATSSPSSAAKQ